MSFEARATTRGYNLDFNMYLLLEETGYVTFKSPSPISVSLMLSVW